MTFDAAWDSRVDLESYSVNALRAMVRARSDQWRDLRLRGELLTELRQRLFDVASIRRAIEDCDRIALEALWLLQKRGGTVSVAGMRGQLATWHPEQPIDEVYRIPNGLVRRALAFWRSSQPRYGSNALHDTSGPATDHPYSAQIFSVPDVLAWLPRGIEPPAVTFNPVRLPTSDEQSTSPSRQVLAMLRAVEERAPRILRSGVIASRDRRAIAQAILPASIEPAIHDERMQPPIDDGGALVDFHRAILETAGLLRVSDDRRLQTTVASLGFIAMAPHLQIQTLLDAWLQAGPDILPTLGHLDFHPRAQPFSSVPDDHHSRAACRWIVDVIRDHVRPGQWYDVEDLSRIIRHLDVEFLVPWLGTSWQTSYAALERDLLAPPIYAGISLQDSRGRSRWLVMGGDWDLVEGAFIRAVVRGPLSWLGVVEFRANLDGREVFALTRYGARSIGVVSVDEPLDLTEADANAGSLIVQPNFDVIVYDPAERPELLYQIDRFAERISVDRLAVYRLTRESLCSGLQLGIGIGDVVGLLERASRAAVPQNVDVSLRDWARQFDSVRWTRNACLLEAPDEATLDSWLAKDVLRGTVTRRISPTVALIDGPDLSRAIDVLSAMTVDVRTIDANDPLRSHAYTRDVTEICVEPGDLNLLLYASLARIAVPLIDLDGRTFFRITPESIEEGIASGLTVDQILGVVDGVLGGHVPPGLRVRVKGWAGAYGVAAIGQVAVVSIEDPQTFRDVRLDPEIGNFYWMVISSTSALVRLSDLKSLRAALMARGIALSSNGWSETSTST